MLIAETCTIGGKDDIGGQHQLEPTGKREAVDRSHHRQLGALKIAQHLVPAFGKGGKLVRPHAFEHFGQIGASTELAATCAQQKRAHARASG